jgi:hypothetical protein
MNDQNFHKFSIKVSSGCSQLPRLNFCLAQVAGGHAANAPVLRLNWGHSAANQRTRATQDLNQQVGEAGQQTMSIIQ